MNNTIKSCNDIEQSIVKGAQSAEPESLQSSIRPVVSEELWPQARTSGSLPRSQPCYKEFEPAEATFDSASDLICLSHLRWDFVYQRPQHLMSRCARERRVFYFEEPIFGADPVAHLDIKMHEGGVCVVVPHLSQELSEKEVIAAQQALIDHLFAECRIYDCLLWYYTPMALRFTRHVKPLGVVYDCMDELSAFRGAPRDLRELETELFNCADIVFTGGMSLYQAKRRHHSNVYAFPSSIDVGHFAQARSIAEDPSDQAEIPHPRLGFFGVIDERMDMALLDGIAQARPDWHLVMIGPVVKIDPSDLPRRPNIHYLGGKAYKDLPTYLAGWDVALLPFAHNESTRLISPTKTPEYLAAGKPVISTSISDVVRTYGQNGLVYIADTVEAFVATAEAVLDQNYDSSSWLHQVDAFLAQTSWDHTWGRMMQLIEAAISARHFSASSQATLSRSAHTVGSNLLTSR